MLLVLGLHRLALLAHAGPQGVTVGGSGETALALLQDHDAGPVVLHRQRTGVRENLLALGLGEAGAVAVAERRRGGGVGDGLGLGLCRCPETHHQGGGEQGAGEEGGGANHGLALGALGNEAHPAEPIRLDCDWPERGCDWM